MAAHRIEDDEAYRKILTMLERIDREIFEQELLARGYARDFDDRRLAVAEAKRAELAKGRTGIVAALAKMRREWH